MRMVYINSLTHEHYCLKNIAGVGYVSGLKVHWGGTDVKAAG